MTTLLTHEAARDYLAEEALGLLSPADQPRVATHVAECPLCQEELRQLREAAGALTLISAAHVVDTTRLRHVRERVLARARAARPTAPAEAPRRRGRPLPAWSGWMLAAGLAALLLTHHTFHRPLLLGWVVAWGFGLLALGLGVYAWVLRRRLDQLRRQGGGASPGPTG